MAALAVIVALLVGGCGGSGQGGASPTQTGHCDSAQIHYSPYPGHGIGLGLLPWICGAPGSQGLVGLLWYWPQKWRHRRFAEPQIYTRGVAPGGGSTKILWTFLAASARAAGGDELTVRGHRLDGPGTFVQRFGAIGYDGQDGAPSYASIIDIPQPGLWRLELSTGRVRGAVELHAIRS